MTAPPKVRGHGRNACVRAGFRTIALVAIVFALAAPASAQVEVVGTSLSPKADRRIGSQYRENGNRAFFAIERGDFAEADMELAQVRRFCDALQRPGRDIVSVADDTEYDAYLAARGSDVPTEWIDIACPIAYHLTGYAQAAQQHYDDALPWLQRASAIAPYYPTSRNERAFVLARMGHLPEALAAYRETLALADAHPSGAYIKPLALRGIGYVLIEMDDLDGAQRSYEAALAIDPGNATAKSELDYIAQQRARRAPDSKVAP